MIVTGHLCTGVFNVGALHHHDGLSAALQKCFVRKYDGDHMLCFCLAQMIEARWAPQLRTCAGVASVNDSMQSAAWGQRPHQKLVENILQPVKSVNILTLTANKQLQAVSEMAADKCCALAVTGALQHHGGLGAAIVRAMHAQVQW